LFCPSATWLLLTHSAQIARSFIVQRGALETTKNNTSSRRFGGPSGSKNSEVWGGQVV
jgi:hypothetical protein